MQITETSSEGLKREYKVIVASDDIEQRMQKRLTELSKQIRMPGFRPGKVPMKVLKQRYGSSVMGEVLEETVNTTSSDTLRDKNLRPALRPKIEIESFADGQDLVYAMSVEVLPDIELPDLSKVELERLKPEIGDEELDEALRRLAERYRKAEAVTDGGAAATGDVLTVDFVGSIDGAEFPGGSATDQALEIGAGRFIPGFEEQLTGAKAGDHVTVKVTFPAEYGAAHLAGKDASFEVDVKELKRKLPPAIDDALAEEVGMENLEALRNAVREQMEADYGRVSRQKQKRDLLDKLAELCQFDVPPGMVEVEFDAIWKQYEQERDRAKEAGTLVEAVKVEGDAPEGEKPEGEKPEGEAVKAEGEDEAKGEYRAIAERRVRLGLLLAEIGRANAVEVTQDEINRAVMAQARQYPGQEKAVLDYYRSQPEAMGALRAPIYEDKVVDFIFEAATVTDKPVPAKDLMQIAGMDEDGEETEMA